MELGCGPGVLAPGAELFSLPYLQVRPSITPLQAALLQQHLGPAVRELWDLEQGFSFPASVSSPAH